jgi:hypothetical protein
MLRNRSNRVRVGLLSLALTLALAAGALTAPHASAAGSGDVQCVYGNNQVVGVWVEVSGGTSGWATRWSDGYGGNFYSYSAIGAGKWHRLHVGCSGTPQNWGITFYTPWVTGYHDWVCTTGVGCYQS